MRLNVLEEAFTLCRIHDVSQINFQDKYCFVAKTDTELSLVCRTGFVPVNTLEREDGWKGFCLQGPRDFSSRIRNVQNHLGGERYNGYKKINGHDDK